MRAGLLTLLSASSVQLSIFISTSNRFIGGVAALGMCNHLVLSRNPFVLTLTGGAVSTTCGTCDSAACTTSAEDVPVTALTRTADSSNAPSFTVPRRPRRKHANRLAWSLPWFTGRRRTRQRNEAPPSSACQAYRSTIVAEKAAKIAPTARAFISARAFIIAMIVSGGTFAVCPQMAVASPFDPRLPPKSSKQPFFEGWFVRLVDHEQKLSFAVIFGSFRSRGEEGPELDQHYVSLSYLHEPIGGILPAEDEEEQNGENDVATSDNSEELEETDKPEAPKSPQERVSAIADSLGRWIHRQRQAALRGFGRDEFTKSIGQAGGGDVKSREGSTIDQDTRAMEDPLKGDAVDFDSTRRGRPVDGPDEAERVADERDGGSTGEQNSLGPEEMDGDFSRHEQGQHKLDNGDRSAALESTRESLLEAEGDSAGGVLDPDLAHESIDAELSEAEEGDSNSESTVLEQTPIPPPVKELPLRKFHPPNAVPQIPPAPPLHHQHLERTHTFHAFPAPETVTISCRGEPVERVPNLVDDPNFAWEADGVGSFTVDGDTGRLSFQLPELSVAATFRHRLPWSAEYPNSAGPEGWLQRTGLLPTHYFVHSMGSEAGYSLKAADAPRAVVGRGSIHMEANYGVSFPTGWVWAQGVSATRGLCGKLFRDGEMTTAAAADGSAGGEEGEKGESPARFVLTGGRFVIGSITTNSFVLAFRSEKHEWNFRTTDLDRITVQVSRKDNRLTVVAKSWGNERVLEADIHAPEGSFGSAIYVPTPEGFSNAPGCVESYAATATFRLYTKGEEEENASGRPLVLREEVEFKLAALEFGGEFQDT